MSDDTNNADKLAIYRGKVGLDLMDALSRDTRLRPILINGECFLSLVNLMEIFGDLEGTSYTPREYWRDQKRRLKKRKIELWEKISQLKRPAPDGKMRLTDVAPLEVCFTVLLYMNTPSSDWFKDLAGRVMARMTEVEMKYRAINIAAGMEWAADSTHEDLKGLEPPDDLTAWEELGYS